jgi:Ca2+-binding RTX toxin-like protein
LNPIDGDSNDNILVGGDDNDRIRGFGGHDDLSGQGGNDRLIGGGGNDSLNGNGGNDLLYGGSGNDRLFASDGIDSLYGGDDDDFLTADVVFSTIMPTMFGGNGNDFFSLNSHVGGHVDGGVGGYDTLRLQWQDNGPVNFNALTGSGGNAAVSLTFVEIERYEIATGDLADVIRTGDVSDAISVSGGANSVFAADGADTVSFTAGEANTLDGGLGADRLEVRAAAGSALILTVTGMTATDNFASIITGFESYEVTGGLLDDTVLLSDAADAFYGGLGHDSAEGADGDDVLVGGGGNDTLSGEAGDDSLTGGTGQDLMAGGTGHDRLNGQNGNDTLHGDDGNDILHGQSGDDALFGGNGRDRLFASLGNNTLTGGADADHFMFTAPQYTWNMVTDFVSGEDMIRIAASGIANPPAPGILDISRLSFGTASGTNAQFILIDEPGQNRSALVWDSNGSDPSGGVTLIGYFALGVAMVAADITLV